MASVSRRSGFRVGDRVAFNLVRRRLTGTIVEDRGPLGLNGRRLFRVEVHMDPDEPQVMTLAEDEVELMPPESEPVRSIAKERVIEYLIYGGLLSMLQTNMPAQEYPRPVWLGLDQLDNVTYTFAAERGISGGKVPPASAVWEGKVSKRRQAEVEAFLESFGLTHEDAQRVIRKVGTAGGPRRMRTE